MFKIPVFVLLMSVSCVLSQDPFGEAHVELITRSYNECSASTNVDLDILQRARNNDFVEDRALMAYYECMFRHEHLNFVDESGAFILEKVREFLHLEGNPELWNEIIAHCFVPAEGDLHYAIYQSVRCFTERVGGRINLYVN